MSLQPLRWESRDLLRLPGQGHDPQILTRSCGDMGEVWTALGQAGEGNKVGIPSTHEANRGGHLTGEQNPDLGTLNREFGR